MTEERQVWLVLESYYGMGEIIYGAYDCKAAAEASIAAGHHESDGDEYVAAVTIKADPRRV